MPPSRKVSQVDTESVQPLLRSCSATQRVFKCILNPAKQIYLRAKISDLSMNNLTGMSSGALSNLYFLEEL
ncbi:hypothetical protein ILYODFUR_027141 [Ilyodon furcidens]|uniref:Uncharacterized protein n=1 Tax=Ilyodon furcidens TaxID=33524 RepID=A0ABV0UVI8_9TELE